MMLFAIREKAKGWFAWLIVILISVPFALWGIGSYITPDPNPPVATVNGLNITAADFQSSLQQEQNNAKSKGIEDETGLRQAVLQRLINNRALISHLNEQGFSNSRAQLDQNITQNSNFNDLTTGQFSQEKFNQFLRQIGLSYAGYRNLLDSDLLVQQYINAIQYGNFITEVDENRLLRLLKQERDVDYILINAKDFEETIEISEEEITNFYEQNKEQYEVPEQIKLAYLEVSREKIAKSINVTEDELKAAYESDKGKYTTSEERQASHILIPIEGDIDESKAKSLIDSVHQRLLAGEDFAVVAKETSKDPGSAMNGGDLGFFKKGDMVPAFEKVTFALSQNETSEPFKSTFGFHIVKLMAIKAEKIKPFSDVIDKIKSSVQYDKAEKQFVEQSELLQTIAYEQPDSLDGAAAAIEQKILFSELHSRGQGGKLFSNPKVVKVAFSDLILEEGNNSDLIEVDQDIVIVVRLEQRIEAKIKELEQVKGQISQQLKSKKLSEKSYEIAQQIEKAFNEQSSPETFDKLLSTNNLSLIKKGFIERGNRDILPAIVQKGFTLPRVATDAKGVASALKVNADESAVVIVRQVKNGTIDDDKMREAMNGLLSQSESSLLTNLSVAQISRQSDIEIFSERMQSSE